MGLGRSRAGRGHGQGWGRGTKGRGGAGQGPSPKREVPVPADRERGLERTLRSHLLWVSKDTGFTFSETRKSHNVKRSFPFLFKKRETAKEPVSTPVPVKAHGEWRGF